MGQRLKKAGETFKFTQREYEGAINALNIFFGAVIGVTLGGTEDMPTGEYVVLLIMTASVVMGILVVSFSHRRLWNSVWLIALIGLYWYFFDYSGGFDANFPDKITPTLGVWAALAIMTEFMPRGRKPEDDQPSD